MSTLSPTGSSRRSPLPAVLAVVLALAVGVGGGWWFAGRDKGTASPPPTSSSSCSAQSPARSSATSTANAVALPKPRTIRLNVYNATTRQGLARSTSTQLIARGFLVIAVGNDPLNKVIQGTAQIRFGRFGVRQAKVVAAQLPHPIMVRDARRDSSVDVVLGDSFSALNTPAQANAQLKATPSPTPSCRPPTG